MMTKAKNLNVQIQNKILRLNLTLIKKEKKVSNVLRDQWGHRAYICNDCPEEKQ